MEPTPKFCLSTISFLHLFCVHGQWGRAFDMHVKISGVNCHCVLAVIYFQCIGVDGTILIVNGQQITVDFGGKKWTLHEMTLAKVSNMQCSLGSYLSISYTMIRRRSGGAVG